MYNLDEHIETIQRRIDGAEYLIRILVQRMSQADIYEVSGEINKIIRGYGTNQKMADTLKESLRLLGK